MLHTSVDHQFAQPDTADIDATLDQDEAARAAVIAWQAQEDRQLALEQDTAADAEPPQLPATTRTRRHTGALGRAIEDTVDSWFGRGQDRGKSGGSVWPQAVAASVLLGLGLAGGWVGHQIWSTPQQQVVDTASLARGLMRDAMVAHLVYAADTRRPVEVTASEQDQLLRWLSRRLGRPLEPPALTTLGWSLVGGRLLPGDTGGASATRAQFMYEDKGGQRLTLYLSVLDPVASTRASITAGDGGGSGKPESSSAKSAATTDAPPADQDGHTLFSFASRDSTHSAHWTEGNFGYTLVGDLPREALERISNEVYLQTVGVTTVADVKR